LLKAKDPAALQAYEDSLKTEPNRFRSITILSRDPPADNSAPLTNPASAPAINLSALEQEIALLKDTVGLLKKENDTLRQDFCTGKE
jgi:hypothetical protein